MGIITALKSIRYKTKTDVFIDDTYSFTLDKTVVAEANIQVGQEISKNRVEELKDTNRYRRCLDAAVSYLSYRPRSEMELEQRLRQRGFSKDTVQKVMKRLTEYKLVDDKAFAQYWKENRLFSNPRSQRLIRQELRQKGIDNEIVGEIVEGLDDEESAYKAGLKKTKLLTSLEYEKFCHRMFNYLRLRGYNYAIIQKVSNRLWQEQQNLLK